MLKNIKSIKGMFFRVIFFAIAISFLNISNISAASNFTSTLSPSKSSVGIGLLQ